MRWIVLLIAVMTSVTNAQDYPAGVYPDTNTTTPPAPAPVGFRSEFKIEATPTPFAEVVRVLDLLPKPEVAFVDFGCGAEARWCIAAAEKWDCKCIGVEIDPTRAALAKERVAVAGLSDKITIIQGDAITTDVTADVGAVYLYEDTIKQLEPKLRKLKAFASYIHEPKGLGAVKNGQTWIYNQPLPEKKTAVWNGVQYDHPVCNNPNCGMCASIRAQLAGNAASPKGHYEVRKVKMCNGRFCWFVDQNVWVPDPQ